MSTVRRPRLSRLVALALLSASLVTAIWPGSRPALASEGRSVATTDSRPAPTVVEVPPTVDQLSLPAVTPSRSWPAGDASGGGKITWTAHRARHMSFRHSTGWWGAASTRISIRGAKAPHVYAFHLRPPRHVTLAKNRFGEVVARRHGHPVGIFGKPWARSSDGHRLDTWYTVRGRTVRQHIRFGRHTHFPVTADPWWNPFTWHWDTTFSVAWKQVSTCGQGAMNALLSIGGTTGVTNILLKHVAGRAALMIPGGAYTYAGFAAWGCLGSFF